MMPLRRFGIDTFIDAKTGDFTLTDIDTKDVLLNTRFFSDVEAFYRGLIWAHKNNRNLQLKGL